MEAVVDLRSVGDPTVRLIHQRLRPFVPTRRDHLPETCAAMAGGQASVSWYASDALRQPVPGRASEVPHRWPPEV